AAIVPAKGRVANMLSGPRGPLYDGLLDRNPLLLVPFGQGGPPRAVAGGTERLEVVRSHAGARRRLARRLGRRPHRDRRPERHRQIDPAARPGRPGGAGRRPRAAGPQRRLPPAATTD